MTKKSSRVFKKSIGQKPKPGIRPSLWKFKEREIIIAEVTNRLLTAKMGQRAAMERGTEGNMGER